MRIGEVRGRVRRTGVALSTLAAILTGCGQGSADQVAGSTAPPASSSPASLLDFSAPLVGGGTFEGTSVQGRPVAFWFWAPT